MYLNRHYKPMLTQQQKNNRRKRASPDQLAYLRKSFMIDPKPDQTTREEIGRHIDMTPRSVQIWFQNNRAKNKLQEKRLKSVCNLPLKTSHCDHNVSRIHVDLNAIDEFPGLNNRFYHHADVAASAPVLTGSTDFLSRDLNNYRNDHYQSHSQSHYMSPDIQYHEQPRRSYPNLHSGRMHNYHEDNFGIHDQAKYRSSTPDTRQFRMSPERMVSADSRYHMTRESSPSLDDIIDSPAIASDVVYTKSGEVPMFSDSLLDTDLDWDLDKLMGTENIDCNDNGLPTVKPEFSIF